MSVEHLIPFEKPSREVHFTRRLRESWEPAAVSSWYRVAGASAPFWRPGDVVAVGTYLGTDPGGRPVAATNAGRVRTIQYDLDRDDVILEVEGVSRP